MKSKKSTKQLHTIATDKLAHVRGGDGTPPPSVTSHPGGGGGGPIEQ